MGLLETFTCVPVAAATVVVALAMILRGRVDRRVAWTVAVVGVASAASMALARRAVPFDYRIFRSCGFEVLAGLDPNAVAPSPARQVALNPPTAWPLFEVFAALPLRKGARLWTWLNVILGVALVPVAYRALRAQGATWAVPRETLAVLTAVVALSRAMDSNLALGQLAIMTAFAIVAALWAQGANRPILAGVGLAFATIKVATMLPFLLLFLRRRDLLTWVTLAACSIGLSLTSTRPTDLPSRLATNLRNIEASAASGLVNDFSYAGPSHASLISLDHALHRLSLRDRDVIRAAQLAALAILAALLVARSADPLYPRDRLCALVALFAMLFLYHRVYDAVILVVTVVFLAGSSATAPRAARCRVAVIFGLVLVPLYAYPWWFASIEAASASWGVLGGAARAVVLPASCWAILGAMMAFGRGREWT